MSKKKKKGEKLSLEELEKRLLAELGDEVFLRGSDVEDLSPIPTGLMSVDKLLGGGFRRGRFTEIYGAPSSSKTLLVLAAMAEAQKQGGIAVFIDLERTFDKAWAKKNGVDIEALRYILPESGEQAWDLLEQYLASGEVDFIGLDSVAQLVPTAEMEDEMGHANIGLAARMNAKAMRRLTPRLGRTAVVLINQLRGNVAPGGYGPSETTAGGKAIPFYAAIRLRMRRIAYIESAGVKVGGRFNIRVEKCKVTGMKPYSMVEFEVDFDTGLDFAKDILSRAINENIIKKAGAWFSIEGQEEKFQGERAIKDYLIESGMLEELKVKFSEVP